MNDLKVPSPDEIKTARRKAGLTQQKAADMVHINIRNWQKWEAGENSPPLAAWELFLLKTGQRKLDDS